MAYATVNPATNAQLKTFESLSDREAERAISRAHATFLDRSDRESFGPVADVYRVKDDDAAVALASDSPHGRDGAVFCRDPARAHNVGRELSSHAIAEPQT